MHPLPNRLRSIFRSFLPIWWRLSRKDAKPGTRGTISSTPSFSPPCRMICPRAKRLPKKSSRAFAPAWSVLLSRAQRERPAVRASSRGAKKEPAEESGGRKRSPRQRRRPSARQGGAQSGSAAPADAGERAERSRRLRAARPAGRGPGQVAARPSTSSSAWSICPPPMMRRRTR